MSRVNNSYGIFGYLSAGFTQH